MNDEFILVSQSLVLRFARWLLGIGGDLDAGTKLLDAARNQSSVIGGRIAMAVHNSSLQVREGLPDKMTAEFGEEATHQLLVLLGTKGPYEWE